MPAFLRRLVPIVLLSLLLLFPSVSVSGAADGLLLWFQVVLPTLSPFLICTQLIIAQGGVRLFAAPFYPLLHAVFGLSLPGCYVLLCGLLCGYPLGARLCADFAQRGELTHEEAAYLLSICNHASPMFLLGYVRKQLGYAVPPLLLLAALYLPILPISLLARRVYGQPISGKNRVLLSACSCPKGGDEASPAPRSLNEILLSAAETMVVIGGYIMLFSILSAWIDRLSVLPQSVRALLSGLAEITTGVHRICAVFPPRQALVPVILCVSFGGCSGMFQTASVLRPAGSDAPQEHFPTCSEVQNASPEHFPTYFTVKNASPARFMTYLVTKNARLSIWHYAVWKALHAFFSYVVLMLLT